MHRRITSTRVRLLSRCIATTLVTLLLAGVLSLTSSLPAWACSCVAPSADGVATAEGAIVGTVTDLNVTDLPRGDSLAVYTVDVELDAFDNVADSVFVGVYDDSCLVTFSLGDVIATSLNPVSGLEPEGRPAVTTGSCSVVSPELVAGAADIELASPRGGRIDIGEGLSAADWAGAVTSAQPGIAVEQPAPVAVPNQPIAPPIPVPVDQFGNPIFPTAEPPLPEPPDINAFGPTPDAVDAPLVDELGNPIPQPIPVDPNGNPLIPTPEPPIAIPAAPVQIPVVRAPGQLAQANPATPEGGTSSTKWIVLGGSVLIAITTAAAWIVDRNLRAQGR